MKKVMIADDSEIVRGVVAIVLGERGLQVVEVGDPAELEATLTRESPDLLLLDVAMPGARMEPLVAMAKRVGGSSCPVVLYSDRPDHELARLVATSGASGYVRKGGEAAVFARHIERLLGV